MDRVTEVLRMMTGIIWGPWTMALFLVTGLWFTWKSGVFQIRGIRCWLHETVGNPDRGSADTSFRTACTALAATIGTGNIAGVATALTVGGPGALFWMWICAGIGMMTAYAETSLGQRFKYRHADGHWVCGPMVYMERGLKCRSLGIVYAVLAVLASLGMGSMAQSNSMSTTLHSSIGIPELGSAVVITTLSAVVILGGARRIVQVAERLMPVSAGIYLIFSGIVIFSCLDVVPKVLSEVVRNAFYPSAAGSGVTGFLMSKSVRYGMSRGVFSNEAGLGSLAVLHGTAENTTPEEQGMWAMFEVFFDTIVICTVTALVILCIHARMEIPPGMDGAALTAWCYAQKLGKIGTILIPAAMTVFAFATIIAWYYLGEQMWQYLMEKIAGTEGRAADLRLYSVLYLGAVLSGCMCRLDLVWLICDLWNGMMAYPNLLALWLLSENVRFPDYGMNYLDKI